MAKLTIVPLYDHTKAFGLFEVMGDDAGDEADTNFVPKEFNIDECAELLVPMMIKKEQTLQRRGGLDGAGRQQQQQEQQPQRQISPSSSPLVGSKTSMEIFMQYVKYFDDGTVDATGILGKECFAEWMSSRKNKLKNPQLTFVHTVRSHVTGDRKTGRNPFPPEVEACLLTQFRKRQVWPCFEGTDVKYGIRGMFVHGYHESKTQAENAIQQHKVRGQDNKTISMAKTNTPMLVLPPQAQSGFTAAASSSSTSNSNAFFFPNLEATTTRLVEQGSSSTSSYTHLLELPDFVQTRETPQRAENDFIDELVHLLFTNEGPNPQPEPANPRSLKRRHDSQSAFQEENIKSRKLN